MLNLNLLDLQHVINYNVQKNGSYFGLVYCISEEDIFLKKM